MQALNFQSIHAQNNIIIAAWLEQLQALKIPPSSSLFLWSSPLQGGLCIWGQLSSSVPKSHIQWTLAAAGITNNIIKARRKQSCVMRQVVRATTPAWYSQTDKFDVSACSYYYQYNYVKHANLWIASWHNSKMSYYIYPMIILMITVTYVHSIYVLQ